MPDIETFDGEDVDSVIPSLAGVVEDDSLEPDDAGVEHDEQEDSQ